MKTTYLVKSQRKNLKTDSNLINTTDDESYSNYLIAKDASKKLDFLILVIETLQINATDSLLVKAKNIG